MARSSGDTLSLNNLAAATGNTQNSNVSLGDIKGSPSAGDNIGLDTFAIDGVDSITGFTYAVESTDETYTLGFDTSGSNFVKISERGANFTWAVSPTYDADADASGYLDIASNSDESAVISVGSMNPQGSSAQTSLLGTVTHTLSVTFNDGYNDHATNYNSARTKTVYSVDSYDGNSTSLCLTVDSPVIKSDGSVIEVGDLSEGDTIKGFAIGGLSTDEGRFLDWDTQHLSTENIDVEVVNLVYSFADSYYNINNGDITATGEHPLLVKDSVDNFYRFKEIKNIKDSDKLVREVDGEVTEVNVDSIVEINSTSEIVTIDVEEHDTYKVNGYISHNKGGNSHTDLTAPGAPTSFEYNSVDNNNKNLTWVAPTSSGTGGITAFKIQVDNNSDFSSPIFDFDEYSSTTLNVVALSAGTYYARVRAIDQGLAGPFATLTFTR